MDRPFGWAALRGRVALVAMAGFAVLVGLPLYGVMLAALVRSDLLRFAGPPFTDAQLNSVLVFLGVVLTVTVSFIGVFLSKVSSDRAFTQQSADADRQTLETAVQVLELLKAEGGYANRVVTTGALTTLVHLRQSVIAMQMLRVALEEEAVDIRTAVWLMDQILRESPTTENRAQLDASKHNAAEWLRKHVDDLISDTDPGDAEWPTCVFAAWPTALSLQCSTALMEGLLQLLVARRASWWTESGLTWTWVVYTLYRLAQEPTAPSQLRHDAAGHALLLLTAVPAGDEVQGLTDTISPEDVTRGLTGLGLGGSLDETDVPEELVRWVAEARGAVPNTPGGQ